MEILCQNFKILNMNTKIWHYRVLFIKSWLKSFKENVKLLESNVVELLMLKKNQIHRNVRMT